MPHILLTRFERRVLRPVWIAHGAFIVVLLFQHHFLITLPLLILWFLYGMVGQALHKKLSAQQLARGEHLSEPEAESDAEQISSGDSYQLSKAIMGFGFILFVTAIIIGFHFGLRWYFAIPLGILAWFSSPFLSIIFAGGDYFVKAWIKDRKGQDKRRD